MKGLELSEAFYREYGEPMLKRDFPTLLPHIAVGLFGAGSECLGYDDEASHDHDFEPGFVLLLPDEATVDRATAFRLERAYAALPKEFMGYRRSPIAPTGGARHGGRRLSDFLFEKTGTPDGALTEKDFFYVPEQSLLEVTNGKVFHDGNGALTAIRDRLSYLPESVRRKKLAGRLLLAGQAGEYNYPRAIARGDTAAAQLCITEFVKNVLHSSLLLGKKYLPYYKWQFRALLEVPDLSSLAPTLEYLLSSPNTAREAEKKTALVAEVALTLAAHLREQGLSARADAPLEAHAYAVNDTIPDREIRNLHILYGV